MKKWMWLAVVCVGFLALMAMMPRRAQAQSQGLALEQYLLQVRGSNPGMKGAKESMAGSEMRTGEGGLLFTPVLELTAQHEDDQIEYFNADFNGTRKITDLYQAAIAQNTPFGLTAKFGYSFMRRTVDGALTTVQPELNYTAAPMIELNLPLWRNGMGSEIRATRDKVNSGNRAQYYGERLKFDGITVEAEMTYSGLYFARQSTIARRDSMDVAKKILDWVSKRAVNELADDNELNQARAAYEARELELLKAQNAERKAARAFNSLRGISTDTVEEELKYTLPIVDIAKFSGKLYDDKVRIAENQKLMAKAEMRLGLERVRPTLEIFGKYSHNGMDAESDKSLSESWKSDHPYKAAGVRFSAPLFFWETNRINDGYRRSLAGADLELQRLHQENQRDLNNLISNIETSQKLVSLVQKLVDTQKKALEKERQRHRRGRTTLFQVLQYEQDYVQTQLAQIGYQAELVSLANQLRLYRGE